MFENICFLQTSAENRVLSSFSIFINIKVVFYFNYISLFISEIKHTYMSFVSFMPLTRFFFRLFAYMLGMVSEQQKSSGFKADKASVLAS